MEWGNLYGFIAERRDDGTLVVKTAGGAVKEVPRAAIVRAARPNALGFLGKLGLYASRVREFLLDDPRESNTEGGIFPAIFGTVMMVFLMSFAVLPLGVLAALWDEAKDRLHESALGLSGGQQQRLCIARAIAVEPEVILLDEPCSALDPIATAKVEELMLDLKNRYTLIIVTHNMQQATRVSDYTAFLYLGSLIEYEETQKLFITPAKKQTEDYITGRFG
jgi:hypothetical protein